MATTIITLTSGAWSHEDGDIYASGNLTRNGSTIVRIDGNVKNEGNQIGDFSANRDEPMTQGQLRYQINFFDPSVAALLVTAVQNAVSAVQEKLQED